MKKIKVYVVKHEKFPLSRGTRSHNYVGTLDNLINDVFGYTLDCGKSWEYESGNYKIKSRSDIKTIKSLISNLNKSSLNACCSYQDSYYELVDTLIIPEDEINENTFIDLEFKYNKLKYLCGIPQRYN